MRGRSDASAAGPVFLTVLILLLVPKGGVRLCALGSAGRLGTVKRFRSWPSAEDAEGAVVDCRVGGGKVGCREPTGV